MNSFVLRPNLVVPALALAWLAFVAAPSLADWPKPIVPPKSDTPAPIAPPSVSSPVAPSSSASSPSNPAPVPVTLPGTVGTTGQTPTALAPVDSAHRHIPPLIDQMLDGKLTPQRAWNEKLLSVDDLLWIFTSYIDPWGSCRWKFNEEVRRGLAGLLIQHGGEKMQVPEKLPPTVRLWLADCYMSVRDEKCVALCEGILKEIKAPVSDEEPLAFQTLERMGHYYDDHGEYKSGVLTWLRMNNYYANKSRFLADALLEEARIYMHSGEEQKAQELYAQVPQYGDGWLSGLAALDQATFLIRQEKHEQARRILQHPINGTNAEKAMVGILSLLSFSYYRTGNFDLATKYSLASIEQFQKLKSALVDTGVEWRFHAAEAVAMWSQQWLKQPLTCEPARLEFSTQALADQPSKTSYLLVQSFQPYDLSVKSDSPKLRARLTGKRSNNELFWQEEVAIDLLVDSSWNDVQAHIMITTLQRPDFEMRIPVRVIRAPTVRLSVENVFFGFVKVGETVSRAVTLSSPIPFRVIKVEAPDASNKAGIESEAISSLPATTQSVSLKFMAKETGQIYQGHVRIFTNVPDQEVIEVPYVASAKE